jgi:hypothetical protein
MKSKLTAVYIIKIKRVGVHLSSDGILCKEKAVSTYCLLNLFLLTAL